MATQLPAPTKAPHAQDGPHYANPSSKPLRGPMGPAERADVQRLTWKLFFVILACLLALGVVLSMVFRHT